jgi:hypothetical protein
MIMQREKGIAYCGLACCVCSENADCAGCREGGCNFKDMCGNYSCCTGKGLTGCWACEDFPCGGNMLDKLRIRAFARFVREYGQQMLLDCLERNEQAGVLYHDEGRLTGDYDKFDTEEEIISYILTGNRI